MSDDTATAGPSTSEAVTELLRQLVDARFVLTDRDGAVTRWSRPAEELFGWPGARMLGRPFAETLGLGVKLPPAGGQLQSVARRKDGQEVEVALALVPVRMSQSLEFNGFLEALEIAAPRGNALAQLQRSHRTVVEWIHAALRGEAHLEEDGLAAGTIVAFRPLKEPPAPVVSEEDEAERAAIAAAAGQIGTAVEAALGRSEGIERVLEDTAAELDQAREEAEVARGEAAKAAERLSELEQAEAGLETEVADTRHALDDVSAQLQSLRDELEHARGASEENARADRQRLQREAEEAQAERERLRRELDDMRTAVEGMRRDLAGAPQAQERLRLQLEQTREKVGALENAVSDERGLAEWVDEVHARLAGFEDALAGVPEAETVQEAARAVRSELAAAQARLEQLEGERASEREQLEVELTATRERLERIETDRAEERAELESELAQTRSRLEELAGAGAELDERAGAVARAELAQERTRLEAEQAETRARIEGLESARSQEREHLEAELAGTRARLEELAGERRPEVERLENELAATREQLQELDRARHEERSTLASELAQTRGKLEMLEHGVASERAEDERRLRAEMDELGASVRELAEGAGRQGKLSADLDETRQLVEALHGRIEQAQVAAVGDEEARLLLVDLRAELAALRAGTLAKSGEDGELRALADEVRTAAEAAQQAQAAIVRMTGRAEEAANAARSHSSRAYDAAGAAEARATRAEQAIETVESEASRTERLARELAGRAAQPDRAGASIGREELAQLEAQAARAHQAARETLAAIEAEAERAQLLARGTLGEIDARAEQARAALAAIESGTDRAQRAASAAEEQATRVAGDADERLQALRAAAERAQETTAEVESNASRAVQAAASAGQEAQRVEAEAARIDQRATQLDEQAALTAAQVQEVGERLRSAEAHAEQASEQSAELGRVAGRADSAAAAAERHATQSADSAGQAAEQAARALEGATAAEGHADRGRESSGAAERHAARAAEAVAGADRQAERAAEHAGHSEGHARRLAEAAQAAERRANEAQHAAAAAAEAAEAARQAAEQADADAGTMRRTAEEAAHGRGYEAPAALTPYRGESPAPMPTGNGAAPPEPDKDVHRPLFGRKRDNGPAREPRAGFDDAAQPMAIMELDGHFRELNAAFSDLVGYSEDEFKQAVWPPVMDRANLPKHREQMKHLIEGKIASADVDTGYVHAQGLLVPLAGTIRLVRDDEQPDHFVLEVRT